MYVSLEMNANRRETNALSQRREKNTKWMQNMTKITQTVYIYRIICLIFDKLKITPEKLLFTKQNTKVEENKKSSIVNIIVKKNNKEIWVTEVTKIKII